MPPLRVTDLTRLATRCPLSCAAEMLACDQPPHVRVRSSLPVYALHALHALPSRCPLFTCAHPTRSSC
eukprot:3940927-Rhodomonas_salina.4